MSQAAVPISGNRTVSWLHVSDLHAGRPVSWDWVDVRKAMIADIGETLLRIRVKPDFLFFTGDAAFGASGRANPQDLESQFAAAAEFLQTLASAITPAIASNRIFIVPGNHDIDRRLRSTAVTEHVRRLSTQDLYRFLADSSGLDRATAFASLGAFRTFIENGPYSHLQSADPIGSFSIPIETNGVKVAVVGWNSAWTCGMDGEQHQLRLGYQYQRQLTSQISEAAEVRILLMHHPTSWLANDESEAICRAIEQQFEFFLHGHRHDSWYRAAFDRHLTLECAATYDAEASSNGYNVVRFDADRGFCDVWFREYVRKAGATKFLPLTSIPRVDSDGHVGIRLSAASRQSVGRESLDAESPNDFATITKLQTIDTGLIGRQKEVEAGNLSLERKSVLLIVGPPGEGKTRLARSLASVFATAVARVAWLVNVQNERRIEPVVRQIAAICRVSPRGNLATFLNASDAVIVLDGFERLFESNDPNSVREFLAELVRADTRARFVITSQVRFDMEGVDVLPLKGLDETSAVALFSRESDGNASTNFDRIAEFTIGRLAGHPLSIKILAGYGRDLALTFEQLTREYDQAWERLAIYSASLDGRTLRASYEMSYEALPAEAQAWFLILGMLPDGLTGDDICRIWVGEEELAVRKTLAVLRGRSLADFDGRAFHVVQPLFRFAQIEGSLTLKERDRPGQPRLRSLAVALDRYYDKFVANNAPQRGDRDLLGKSRLVRDHFLNIHASIDRRMKMSVAAEGLTAAQSVLRLNWAYHNNLTGRKSTFPIEDSVEYLSRARRAFEANGASGEALQCGFYIGQLNWLRGDVLRAREQLSEVIASPSLPKSFALECRRAFAHMEYTAGDIAMAVTMLLDVAKLADAQGEHRIAIQARMGLIDAYRKLEQFGAANELFDSLRFALENELPAVRGNVFRAAAYAKLSEGNLSEAQLLYGEALVDLPKESPFGEAHCRRGLGCVFTQLGKYSEAAAEFQRARELYIEARKEKSLGMGLLLIGEALLSSAHNNTAEAVARLELAINLLDASNLNEGYDLARAYEHLGDIYATDGHPDDALGMFRLAAKGYAAKGCERPEARVLQKVAQSNEGPLV